MIQMVLLTVRPFKHRKTGVYYFRKVVPSDLRPLVGKWEDKRTLGTKDPAEARKLHAELAVVVEREWSALRSPALSQSDGPKSTFATRTSKMWWMAITG